MVLRILPRSIFSATRLLYLVCLHLSGTFIIVQLNNYRQYVKQQTELTKEQVQRANLLATDQLAWMLRDFRVKELNCLKLISGDASELSKGLRLSTAASAPLSDYHYVRTTCQDHRSRLVMSTLSDEERQFPLAFSIMVYKDFHQLIALLRAIYRPEHVYCLHVDSKASLWFSRAVESFAKCVNNVHISKANIDVQWHRYSVVHAELSCWKLLLESSTAWRYLINLTGQEFPLRTMRELVGILKQLQGANNIENSGPVTSYEPYLLPAALRANGRNGSVVWHKGAVHVVVCRGFVQFTFGAVGLALLEDLRMQYSLRPREPPTDEVLFATINYNSAVFRVPGAPIDATAITDNVKLPFLPRYKNWITGLYAYPCLSGKVVRGVCIWGLADLPDMNRRFELFVNKFHADFQPLALRCQEERFWHNTLVDYGLTGLSKTWTIQLEQYSNYSFVRQHV